MIKYLHVRQIDEDGTITPYGGLTVAYTCTPTDICFQVAMCHDDDLFCYDRGRRIARGRLQSPKTGKRANGTDRPDITVIPLEHPITQTIVSWLELEWFASPIDIHLDHKFRWVSTFRDFDEVVVSNTDWVDHINMQIGELEGDQGLRYDG